MGFPGVTGAPPVPPPSLANDPIYSPQALKNVSNEKLMEMIERATPGSEQAKALAAELARRYPPVADAEGAGDQGSIKGGGGGGGGGGGCGGEMDPLLRAIMKMLRGEPLTEEEKKLIGEAKQNGTFTQALTEAQQGGEIT